jgi:DNA topoisomerase-1
MKNLVIVESPAKGKTIEKYLGKDFTNLGIDILHGFAPTYVVSEEKKKVVSELKKLVKEADTVILATDPDREGEAIAWHLCETLGLDSAKTPRVTYQEITKTALEDAFSKPGKIDMDLVNAQQSRRILDRLVGFQISPVLWSKIRQGLSAGRVQSVAVKLIVEREREIRAFVPEESWKLSVLLETPEGASFEIGLAKVGGKNFVPKNRDEAMDILASLGADVAAAKEKKDKKGFARIEIPLLADFRLDGVEKKEGSRFPGAPFTTSTLQQEASRKLGMSVGQTMSVAQSLYQNGHITYMRTDSVHLSDFAIKAAKDYIEGAFGKEYALPNGRQYKNKQANAQEAHEAIRPSHLEKSPDAVGLDGADARLYRLIWERTIASQMKEALVETTAYAFIPEVAAAKDQIWAAKGEVVRFPGFMKLYVEGTDEEETEDSKALPYVAEGAVLPSKGVAGNQTFTRPPARYTEAALVKKLESEGIGRPATYAPIISTIVERGYVEKIEKKLAPTDIAFTVNDFLEQRFPEMMDYKFTANVEEEFDKVSNGKLQWQAMLTEFYGPFSERIKTATEEKGKAYEKVGRACPECGSELVYKFSKSGRFIGCSNYPACSFIENIVKPGEAERLAELREKYEGKPCPAGGTIVVKTGRFGPFLSSSLYPEVKWIGKIPDPKIEALQEKYGGEPCSECGKGTMVVKSSRRGPFLACSNYPECKNAKNLPKDAVKNAEESSEGGAASDDGDIPLPPDPFG